MVQLTKDTIPMVEEASTLYQVAQLRNRPAVQGESSAMTVRAAMFLCLCNLKMAFPVEPRFQWHQMTICTHQDLRHAGAYELQEVSKHTQRSRQLRPIPTPTHFKAAARQAWVRWCWVVQRSVAKQKSTGASLRLEQVRLLRMTEHRRTVRPRFSQAPMVVARRSLTLEVLQHSHEVGFLRRSNSRWDCQDFMVLISGALVAPIQSLLPLTRLCATHNSILLLDTFSLLPLFDFQFYHPICCSARCPALPHNDSAPDAPSQRCISVECIFQTPQLSFTMLQACGSLL